MRPPGDKPTGAGFIYSYDTQGLSSPETKSRVNIVYKHRLNGNYVDIQFRRTTETALRARVAEILEHGMSVEKAGKSASIRVQVPTVDFRREPEGQEDAIRAGLYAAERLRRFFLDHGLAEILNSG